MKILKAKLKDSGETLTVKEISKLDKSRQQTGNLECPSCGCLLTFSAETGKMPAYLRTCPNQNHSTECKNYFTREVKRVQSKNGERVAYRMTVEDRRDKQSHMYYRLKNGSATASKPKKNKSHVTRKSTVRKIGVRYVPTTDTKVDAVSSLETGARPSYRMTYRNPGMIKDDLLGLDIDTGGFLEEVIIKNETHVDFLIEYGGKKETVKLFPDYFGGNQVGLLDRIKSLKNYIDNDGLEKVLLTCTVAVRPSSSDGSYELVIHDENCISLDNKTLPVFLGLNSK